MIDLAQFLAEDVSVVTEIGRIERVRVRSIWPDEAQDFTPWLATNLSLLGDELGLELELVEQEAAVGDFSLDILAKDILSDRQVAIENQLEASDHRHLGQLLTYASGHNAGIVVWIAAGFREEHRSAIEWLNRGTNDEIDFYAVEVRGIRIGDSLPAPLFQTVAHPPRRIPRERQPSARDESRDEWYGEFYRPLLDRLEGTDLRWNRRWGPSEQYFESGFGDIFLGVIFFSKEQEAQVLFWIQFPEGETTDQVFDALQEYADSINEELGLPDDLTPEVWWRRRGNRRSALVGVSRDQWEAQGDAAHDEIREWMAEYIEKFYRVFKPRLQAVAEETGVYDE